MECSWYLVWRFLGSWDLSNDPTAFSSHSLLSLPNLPIPSILSTPSVPSHPCHPFDPFHLSLRWLSSVSTEPYAALSARCLLHPGWPYFCAHQAFPL